MSGEAAIIYEGVTYPCDKPPYSGANLGDEGKYERKLVGGKEEYEYVKTGKRTLLLLLNDSKNHQNLTLTIYFDGKTGEKTALANDGTAETWAGKSLYGKQTGKVNLTSVKQLEKYKYLMSGTFEKDVVSEKRQTLGKKYHFKGHFKDFVVQDMEDPKVQGSIKQHAPDAFKKANEEMKKQKN
ncbi:MAG: hypothetical protein IPN76_34075 [Saprospiraceae bacterium]|nr:hypothetical protein [Saprospiraceae bacterium]